MLDREENTESSYEKLKKMIGLASVKEQINHIIAADIVEKERKKRRGSAYESGTMHMIFGGNPGSAKTTVAKLFAGIAKEKGILKSGAFVERGGMDLDSLGCVTAIRDAFTAAKGGVLFIDEAYSLQSDTAVTVLIQEMENRRSDVIVILAGYNERIRAFMDHFGNGRYVRNLIEHAAQNQSIRLLTAREYAENIRGKEFFLLTGDDISMLEESGKSGRKSGTARKEFEEMIGLSFAKRIIHKAIAAFKLKKICMDKGIGKENPSLHMVFTGNPGTAKTTVARLFAEIMKDEKVLPSGNFVEAGRGSLH